MQLTGLVTAIRDTGVLSVEDDDLHFFKAWNMLGAHQGVRSAFGVPDDARLDEMRRLVSLREDDDDDDDNDDDEEEDEDDEYEGDNGAEDGGGGGGGGGETVV